MTPEEHQQAQLAAGLVVAHCRNDGTASLLADVTEPQGMADGSIICLDLALRMVAAQENRAFDGACEAIFHYITGMLSKQRDARIRELLQSSQLVLTELALSHKSQQPTDLGDLFDHDSTRLVPALMEAVYATVSFLGRTNFYSTDDAGALFALYIASLEPGT